MKPQLPRLVATAVAASVGCAAMILGVLATEVDAGAASATAASGAGGRICVEVAIDGTAAGGTASAGCVRVPAGDTGIQVLEAGGHTLTTREDGDFVCSIDDVPASGCSGVDADHYWTYWHRAPGSTKWTYSSEGAGSYRPAAGSTEGWVYDNGGAARPPNGVAQLCPTPRPSSPPSPTASAPPVRPQHSSPPAGKSTGGGGSVGPATPASPSASNSAEPRNSTGGKASRPGSRGDHNAGRHRAARRHRGGRRSTPGGVKASAASPTRAATEHLASGGGSAWEVAIVAVAIAVLGGAALLRFRRSRP